MSAYSPVEYNGQSVLIADLAEEFSRRRQQLCAQHEQTVRMLQGTIDSLQRWKQNLGRSISLDGYSLDQWNEEDILCGWAFAAGQAQVHP